MRGDLKDLFTNLMARLDSKKLLLNSLLENEKSASDLIKNRNDAEDNILKIIENETDIIEEINVFDYYISQTKDEISRRYNLDFDKLFRKEYQTPEIEFLNYRNEIILHRTILDEIIVLKKKNNLLMDNSLKDLEIQISELERLDRIQMIIPKDLQSS